MNANHTESCRVYRWNDKWVALRVIHRWAGLRAPLAISIYSLNNVPPKSEPLSLILHFYKTPLKNWFVHFSVGRLPLGRSEVHLCEITAVVDAQLDWTGYVIDCKWTSMKSKDKIHPAGFDYKALWLSISILKGALILSKTPL